MSNHAYIYGKLPSIEQIDEDVRDIIQKQFPEFTVSLEKDCWLIECDHIRMAFWHSKFRRKPCLEFRHSHRYPMMWWIEYEIREQLAIKYKLKEYDEGIGSCKPEYKLFSTYEDFYRYTHDNLQPGEDRDAVSDKLEIFFWMDIDCHVGLPEKLRKYLTKNKIRKVKIETLDGGGYKYTLV